MLHKHDTVIFVVGIQRSVNFANIDDTVLDGEHLLSRLLCTDTLDLTNGTPILDI